MILVTWPIQKSPSHDLKPSSLLKEKRERRRWTQLQWDRLQPDLTLALPVALELVRPGRNQETGCSKLRPKYARLWVFK